MSKQITVRNPWFHKDGPYSRPAYELTGKPVFQHRGVDVYKRTQSFMYVLGDTAIDERVGFKKETATQIIDALLDGEDAAADAVVAHLRANGFKGYSYSEALTA